MLVTTGDDAILNNHRSNIAVVCCRLPGFRAFAETTDPEEVMSVLGQYHHAVGELIHRYGATVGGYAGATIQVFFNDPIPCPDPPWSAVRMAIAIRQTMLELAQSWAKRGYPIGFGAAVTHGYATVGQIGFAARVDYAAVGPVVDLAEELSARAVDAQVLITQRVLAAIEQDVEVVALGELALSGFVRPVEVFNVERLRAGRDTSADSNESARLSTLSSREREVALLVVRGLTNRQIVEELVISERTVEGHVDHIREKLGVRSRAEIAVWVVQHQLAVPPRSA